MLEGWGEWPVAGGVLGVAEWWCSRWWLPAAKGSRWGRKGTHSSSKQNGVKERGRCLDVLGLNFHLVTNEIKTLLG